MAETGTRIDSISLRFLRRLPRHQLEVIVKEAKNSSEEIRHNIDLGDGIVFWDVKYANRQYYWTFIINEQIYLKNGFLRIDYGTNECNELEGHDLSKVIPHPLFENIKIKSITPIMHAYRRNGVTMMLDKKSCILEQEEDWQPVGVGQPVCVNKKYAEQRRLLVSSIFSAMLESAEVDCEKIQKSYENIVLQRYSDFVTEETLALDDGILPMWFPNFSNRIRTGMLCTEFMTIRRENAPKILVENDLYELKVTIFDKLPSAVVATMVGRNLSDVLGFDSKWNGCKIIKARRWQDQLILRAEPDFVPLPVVKNSRSHGFHAHEGNVVFADGKAFDSFEDMIMQTHPYKVERKAHYAKDHLDLEYVLTTSKTNKETRVPAIRMFGFRIDSDLKKVVNCRKQSGDWWILGLKSLAYEKWENAAKGHITIGYKGAIFSKKKAGINPCEQ